MAGKRVALLIASGEYEDLSFASLPGPAQDVQALGRVLADPAIGDFEVETLVDKSSHLVQAKLEAFLVGRDPDDTLLVYFAGHGFIDDYRRLYFATPNSQSRIPRSSSVPAEFLNHLMADCRSRRQILLLDCCNSGAFARGVLSRGDNQADTKVAVAAQLEGRGRVILTASDEIQFAFEGRNPTSEGTFSFFTSALVRGLETGAADLKQDGTVSFEELADYVYDQVTAGVPSQRPRRWVFDAEGDLVIAKNPMAPRRRALQIPRALLDWQPYELPWPDGSTLVVLPVRDEEGGIICLGKYPITNAQYQEYVKSARRNEPIGKNFIEKKWVGPFHPWRDPMFNLPDQPVVCVSFQDARSYCRWVNSQLLHLDKRRLMNAGGPREKAVDRLGLTRLPTILEWDFAAYGTIHPSHDPEIKMNLTEEIHHQAEATAPIDRAGTRTTYWGISDLIGNVWEWCTIPANMTYPAAEPMLLSLLKAEVRGGGFLDDLRTVKLELDSLALPEGENCRLSDVGFRIIVSLPIDSLPDDVVSRLRMSLRTLSHHPRPRSRPT